MAEKSGELKESEGIIVGKEGSDSGRGAGRFVRAGFGGIGVIQLCTPRLLRPRTRADK